MQAVANMIRLVVVNRLTEEDYIQWSDKELGSPHKHLHPNTDQMNKMEEGYIQWSDKEYRWWL